MTKLDFQPVSESPKLISTTMVNFLKSHQLLNQVKVAPIDPQYADGVELSQHYDVQLDHELNCLIFKGERNGQAKYAAVVVPSGQRVNAGAVLKHAMDASKVSFADLPVVLKQTKMDFGSITPVGLPDNYQILIDQNVKKLGQVIVGSGKKDSKMMVSSKTLLSLPNAHSVANLAKPA